MENLKIGNIVKIKPDTIFLNSGKEVSQEILKLKVHVRDIKDNTCVIARAKTGPVLGTVNIDDVEPYVAENDFAIEPYVITVLDKNVPLYYKASKSSGIVRKLNQFVLLTIIDERDGFGKIKNGSGWIELSKGQRL